ncbi:MAG: hypothetical protein H0X39_13610 [Actinobacteria bacterium]|nr:hypothetical protein [Actinomycetota bacterium]
MTLPLENATYTARAASGASISPPSQNGNRQIALTFEVSQGEHAGETITWIAAFHNTPDKKGRTGVDRIIESLQYLGWTGDEIAELVDIDEARVAVLFPNEVELACSVEEYDGNTRLRVNWVNRLGGGRFTFKEPLKGADLKSFSSQMRGQIRNMQGAKKASNGASKPDPHPNAPGVKDDLPFLSCEIGHEPSPIARVLR